MTPSPAAVTAQGVREGERGALAALVERRGAAVLAYCDHLAAPDRALEAAGEAFAAFRRAVRSAEDPVALDPEALLLQVTRRAAATRAPRPAAPNGLLRRRRAATCQFVPELLAARADGELSAADRLRLGRHLEHCEDCRAAEERFVIAERAYVDAPSTPPEAGVAGGLLAALRAAAPNADERAAPHPPAEGNGASAGVAPDEPAAGTEPAGPPTLSWDPAELLAAAEAAEQRRDWGALAARIVVPAVVAVVAAGVALIVAGAFSGGGADNPATSIQTQGIVPPATVRVLQRPATTPLPPSTSSSSPATGAGAGASAPTGSVPPRAAQRASSDAGSAPAQPVRAVVPARPSTATVDTAGTGGTEATPPTNGGAPASSQAGFTPSP